MGIGLLLSALSGGGEGVNAGLVKEQQYEADQDLMNQKSNLDAQKAMQLAQYNNIELPNQARAGLLQRIAPTQVQLDNATIANAVQDPNAQWVAPATQLNADGTAPDGTASVAPAITDLSDSDRAQYAPTGKQLLSAQIQNALASGDLSSAADMTKIADAGKLVVGYGGQIADENDIDPETGQPRVLIDNSLGRTNVGMANADARMAGSEARQTAADALEKLNDAKVVALQAKPTGELKTQAGVLKDQSISLNKQIVQQTNAQLMTSDPGQRAAIAANLQTLNGQLGDVTAQQSNIVKALAQKASGVPAAAPSIPSRTPSSPVLTLPSAQSALVSGNIYQTVHGPAKWNGKSFQGL